MLPPPSPVEELPRWLRQRARHVGVVGGGAGRLRFITAITLCILLGFLLTTFLGDPGNIEDVSNLNYYDATNAAGVLYGPDGFDNMGNKKNPALTVKTTSTVSSSPSIKSALAELHHAVSGSLGSWKTSLYQSTPGDKDGGKGNTRHAGVFSSLETHNGSSSVMEEVISPGRDLLGARTRVGKVTIIFGGAPTYERAVRTHELHDRIHGYPLHVLRHGILDDVWSKPAYILSLLLKELSRPETERLQWLLWVDADTILLNPHVPIETFLPPEPEFDDVHLLITNDWNGLNNGVFPIRVNQWAVDLFAAIVSFRHYKPDANLVFRDQSAMDMLLKDPKFAKHTMQAPQRWFNAYQGEHNETLAPFQVRRGDFLVHFAGVGDRDRRMAYWLDRVDQHLPDWEIEVHHTSYPSEAREFWAQQRQLRSDTAQSLEGAKTSARQLLQATEEQMAEFRVRLQAAEIDAISVQQANLRAALDKPGVEAASIHNAIQELEKASAPLTTTSATAQKAQLKNAHEALFVAEKALLTHTVGGGHQPLQDATASLQELVMQTAWGKGELGRAVDRVREKTEMLEKEAAAVAAAAAAVSVSSSQESKAIESARAASAIAAGVKAEVLSTVSTTVEGIILMHTQTSVQLSTSVLVVVETRAAEALKGK